MPLPGTNRPEQLADLIAEFVRTSIEPLAKRVSELEARESKSLADSYRGPWLPEVEYQRGQLVTHQGALWMAVEAGSSKPGGAPQWRMIVKSPR